MDKDIQRIIIKNEIDRFEVEYGLTHSGRERWWWVEFFNNFILVLICWSRENLKKAGQLGEFFGQEESSEKFKTMTIGDFYNHIEQTVKDCGYKPKKLLKFYKKASKPLPWFLKSLSNYYINRWLKICIPLYIYLREKGYNYFDLTR